MTRDLDAEVRDRLRRAELPYAPDALRSRVATVAATKPASGRAAELGRSGRFIVPIAAILVIGAMAILGGGSRRGPENPEWGPLAVSSEENGDQARNEGFLAFTETCAFLERGGDREILVWPAARTSWDAATATVTFRGRDEAAVSVRNGDYIELGGGGSSIGEDGLSAAEWTDRIPWVARPAPGCVGDSRFVLNHVAIIEAPPVAKLEVNAFLGDRCLSIGGCAYAVELSGATERWHTDLEVADAHADMGVGPGLPETLEPGRYTATAWIYFMPDVVILPNPRPSFGAERCSVDFEVSAGDQLLTLDVHFNPQACTIEVGTERSSEPD